MSQFPKNAHFLRFSAIFLLPLQNQNDTKMAKRKILFINQEIYPYVPETTQSILGRELPRAMQDRNHEIRTFMPKWGTINERRGQLHEVIRLSGMNLIINDTDHPLIIKVASIQSAKVQVYFIDNDDYFMNRNVFNDNEGNPYIDNGERAVFYARGVLETVTKLRWIPDVIYCQGWISSIVPLYIKKAFNDEPAYQNAKVVYAATQHLFKVNMGRKLLDAIEFKDIHKDDLVDAFNGKYGFNQLQKLAIKYSDGLILEDNKVDKKVLEYARGLNIPILEYQGEKDYTMAYSDFFDSIMEE